MIRGRLGWAVGPNFLIYGTGGGAFDDVRTAVSAFPGATTDRAGWAAGAGVGWMFAPHRSGKLEWGGRRQPFDIG